MYSDEAILHNFCLRAELLLRIPDLPEVLELVHTLSHLYLLCFDMFGCNHVSILLLLRYLDLALHLHLLLVHIALFLQVKLDKELLALHFLLESDNILSFLCRATTRHNILLPLLRDGIFAIREFLYLGSKLLI